MFDTTGDKMDVKITSNVSVRPSNNIWRLQHTTAGALRVYKTLIDKEGC